MSAIFTSLTLDAGIGTGLYINGNLGPFELTSGSYQDFLAIHYSWDDGFNVGQNWEESGGVGIYGFSVGENTHQFTPWGSIAGRVDSSVQREPVAGSIGIGGSFYLGLGLRYSMGYDMNRIVTELIEIWTD